MGWALTTMGEVAEIKLGKMLDAVKNKGRPVPYLRNVNVRWGSFDLSDVLQMRMTADELEAFAIKNGDLLVCEGGEPGRAAIWRYGPTELKFQKALHRARPYEGISPDFLAFYLKYASTTGDIQAKFTGTTIRHLPLVAIKNLELPLPPAPEQRRIVAKIDSLSANSKRASDNLDHVPRLVEKYKQAILVAAFRGELTQDLRAAKGWPAWTCDLAKNVCAKVQSGGTPKAGFTKVGVPFLKVYNIVNQRISFEYRPQCVHSSVHEGALSKSRAYPGDVLMNIVGPPLGKVAIVPATYPEWNINQALTLFRPSEKLTSKWIYYFLCSGQSVEAIVHETRGMVGQVNISLTQCRDFTIPVPSVGEQQEIVHQIEAAFAWVDRLSSEASIARKLIDHLDQAILAKAFRGELVPQDPSDEPASVLLERISARRQMTYALPRPKKQSKASRPRERVPRRH